MSFNTRFALTDQYAHYIHAQQERGHVAGSDLPMFRAGICHNPVGCRRSNLGLRLAPGAA